MSLTLLIQSLWIDNIDQTFDALPKTSIGGRLRMLESGVRAYCQFSQESAQP